MKWFKHESSAGDSPRLRRLRAKYGAEGYGLYWFLVEQVGIGWETHGADINPSLEIEDVESELRIPSGQAPDMIRWMIEKGLFEASTIGLLKCESLRNHVGEAQRKAERRDRPKLNSGQAPDSVRIVSGSTPEKEEIRVEEKREEKTNTPRKRGVRASASGVQYDDPDFNTLWSTYPNKNGKFKAFKAWQSLKPDTITRTMIDDAIFWQRKTLKWTKNDGEYVPMLATYLNNRMWEDEKTVGDGSGQDDFFAGCEKV